MQGRELSRSDRRRLFKDWFMPTMARNCSACGCAYAPVDATPAHHPQRPTRDHILPVAWGGRAMLPGGIRNMRWLCQACNRGRGACGHCLGALACVRAIAQDCGQSVDMTITSLGMKEVDDLRPRVSYTWQEADPSPPAPEKKQIASDKWIGMSGRVIDRGRMSR